MIFEKFINWIRGVYNKMFDKVGSKFNTNVAISDKMINSINLWTKIYENKSPWLDEKVFSLELGSSISREIATMVTLEFKSDITGSPRADFINKCYKNIKSSLRKNVEYACAKGGMVFKPYVSNKKIYIEAIQADKFLPTEFTSDGKCVAGIFVCQKQEGRFYLTRLEYHKLLENNNYFIQNRAFKSYNSDNLGQEIDLHSVAEWSDIEEETIILNVEKPLFGYFKIPFANSIDSDSNIGVSVYSRSIDLIKEADVQFSRILWEFEGSELAIDADPTTLQKSKIFSDQFEMPKLKDRLFRCVGGQSKDGKPFYNVFSPEIRDTPLYNGLNNILKRIEFNCGLAYGTISDPQLIEKTAEEIKTSKQRSYATVSDIQKSLQDALEDLIYAIDVLCTLYKLAPKGKYEVSFEWDDSIIVDAQKEQAIMMQEASQGFIKKEIYLMKRYGVTEEQAREMMPNEDLEKEQKTEIDEE